MFRVVDCLMDGEVMRDEDKRAVESFAERKGGKENCYIVEQVVEKKIEKPEIKTVIAQDKKIVPEKNDGQNSLF